MKNVLLLVHDDVGQESRYQVALDLTRALQGHLMCLDVTYVPPWWGTGYYDEGYVIADLLTQEAKRGKREQAPPGGSPGAGRCQLGMERRQRRPRQRPAPCRRLLRSDRDQTAIGRHIVDRHAAHGGGTDRPLTQAVIACRLPAPGSVAIMR